MGPRQSSSRTMSSSAPIAAIRFEAPLSRISQIQGGATNVHGNQWHHRRFSFGTVPERIDAMAQTDTRSLQLIKRETEQTRAGLTNTVEELRATIADTASDIRQRISPEAIK